MAVFSFVYSSPTFPFRYVFFEISSIQFYFVKRYLHLPITKVFIMSLINTLSLTIPYFNHIFHNNFLPFYLEVYSFYIEITASFMILQKPKPAEMEFQSDVHPGHILRFL